MNLLDLFESQQQCPECGGISFSDLILAEKKDACYYKVKASAKVWPSAYASGRLVQCRKKGADNYGNSKNEGVAEGSEHISSMIQQYEDMVELVYDLPPGRKKNIAIDKRDALEAQIEAMPGGKEALRKWAKSYNDAMDEGVAEAAGLYGSFTVTINTGERPQSRTKTKKFRREDDAILWAQDWLDDFPQYSFATAEVTDPEGNVVWTTDEQGVAEGNELAEEFDLIESIIDRLAEHNGVDAELIWEDLESLTDDELYVFAVTTPLMEDWQKANKQDRTDGMSRKAVNAYRRENPGSKLKTAVTTKPSKLKKGSKASKRRSSYCSRSRGQMKMHSISCAKTPDKAICKARRRWNCESVDLGQTVPEAINPDITNPAFSHQQQIGDYLYVARYWSKGLKITAYHGAKQIGYAELMYQTAPFDDFADPKTTPKRVWLESEWTRVDPKYQRQGIMSTMYAYAKMLGNSVKPSQTRSDDAKAAWSSWRQSGDAKHLTSNEGVAEGLPGSLSKSDYTSGKTVKHTSSNCTTCHGRKSMYKVGDKLFADNKPGATKVKCPTCKGTGDKQGMSEGYDEDEGNPVMNAIIGRIMRTRPDLLDYGMQKLQAAIRDVALDVGDVDEIGSSDISGWVKRVEQNLSGAGMAEGDNEKIGGRYDPEEFDSMVQRLKKLAGAGPMKTVYDPEKRVYRNMPVAQQPTDKK